VSNDQLPAVSIVIIGRNEAGNIQKCVESVLEIEYPQELLEIIYVDTGSTDGTQNIARTMGVKVVEELNKLPSAALARNKGLAESNNRIVHFLDGDMVIDPGYLKKAVRRLGNGDIACVFGRVIERHANTNWISRMLNIDWKMKKEGYINAPGGGGTFTTTALKEIGGYNGSLVLAEETDVGIRLRNVGHSIYMINDIMAAHDYGVNTVSELCKRFYSHGIGRFRILTSDNVPPEIRKWSYKLPLQAMAILLILLASAHYGYLLESIILVTAYPIIYIIIALMAGRKYMTKKGDLDPFLYFYISAVMKPIILLGMLKESVVYSIKQLKKKNQPRVPKKV
jgi:glycosyltransferase involved in cell wall biosynthesis